jgi:hypothetical protein
MTKGEETYWLIRPDHAAWGSQKVVIRSSLPFRPGERLKFPELSPLGYGKADTYLRIVRATREPIAPEGTSGLLAVAATAVPAEEELDGVSPASAWLARGSTWNYHVDNKEGKLWVRKSDQPGAAASDRPEARATYAEIASTLAPDGSLWGLARYALEPRPGPFLALDFPRGSTPVWASVNGTATAPLGAGRGRWEVPLTEEPVSRVMVLWSADPPDPDLATGGPFPLPLPVAVGGAVPTVVTVRVPEGVAVASPSGLLAPSTVEAVELEKARWLERQTAGSLHGLDRSLRRDGENLAAALIQFGLTLRQAERAAGHDPTGPPGAREDRLRQTSSSAAALRAKLSDEVVGAAFEEYETAARAYLGLSSRSGPAAAAPATDPSLALKVRPLGRPRPFLGTIPAAPQEPLLVWSRDRTSDRAAWSWLAGLVGVASALAWLAWRATRPERQPAWVGRVMLAALLAVVAVWAGPTWLAAAAGLAVVGRLTGP